MNTKTETSVSCKDSFLPLKKRMKPLDDDVTNMRKKVMLLGNAKYKGVVQQHNGHWGAQIYVHHRRIWLGTFKSAEEAASAYDSASIKLRSFEANSHRNFPWSDFTVHEPDFQECYTTDDVLDMIKDGSYQQKFREFLRIRSQIVESKEGHGEGGKEQNKCFSCTQLFQKELTPSDVGKLNRLVIPKKYAVKYLPFISDDQNKREDGEIGDVDDVEVVFYDRAMRQWKFRYCYWRSSQSFVFTRGWNGFVKEKNLKEKDVIVFYTCAVNTLEGQSKNFLMIDIVTKELNEMVYNTSVKEMKTGNILNSKLEDEETVAPKNKPAGFMLFGVLIQ